MLFSRRVVFTSTLTLAFLVLLLSPRESRADNFVITSGYVAIGGPPFSSASWSIVGFNFSGNGFAALGGASESYQGIMSPCIFDPCKPGAVIFPNSNVSLDGPGAATFNGTTIGAWWFARDSVLSFSGPSVVIPNSSDPLITITTPFVMTGSVFVHTLFGSIEHPVIFSTTISGSGIATMTLNLFPHLGPGGYIYSNVQYDFQPVPEPTTLFLFTTGVVGLAARYRSRRLQNRSSQS